MVYVAEDSDGRSAIRPPQPISLPKTVIDCKEFNFNFYDSDTFTWKRFFIFTTSNRILNLMNSSQFFRMAISGTSKPFDK